MIPKPNLFLADHTQVLDKQKSCLYYHYHHLLNLQDVIDIQSVIINLMYSTHIKVLQ